MIKCSTSQSTLAISEIQTIINIIARIHSQISPVIINSILDANTCNSLFQIQQMLMLPSEPILNAVTISVLNSFKLELL